MTPMMACGFGDQPYYRTMFALPVLVMLVLAACADDVEEEGPGFLPGGSINYPTGSDDVIVRIEELDRFSYMGDATELPLLSLYGDGTLILLDRQAGVAETGLPRLERNVLNEEGIRYILGAAQFAGLYGGDERYAGPYEDVPVTRFTVTTTGSTSVTRVDGLHVTDPDDIPADEREDRERLSELVEELVYSRDVWLTDDVLLEEGAAFEIERLQVVSLPDETPPGPTDPVWPLEDSLVDLHERGSQFRGEDIRCFELRGEDAGQFIAALGALVSSGQAGTTWQSDDQLFDLYVRPLLPDQQACE